MYNQEIVKKVKKLSRESIHPRASQYDELSAYPEKNLVDLHREGLLNLLISEEYGGLGLGHKKSDILTQWMVTKELAKADMSFARIWEGHSNAVMLIDAIGNRYQKERWFAEIQRSGKIWACWSGEPQTSKPGVTKKYGTKITEKPEGYVINGRKIFCSGAPGVDHAILFVSTSGPGGARHSEGGHDLIMLACDMNDPSISLDDSWWNPIGMKASVSHLVEFKNTFIPKENLIGYPGQYIKENWQTRLTPQYASCFLGGAEGAYTYTLEYVEKQQRQEDPYVQHRLASMSINIKTGNLWLRHVADLWTSGDESEAIKAGNSARYIIEQLSIETVQHAVHICGARGLIKPSRLEKIFRDISFYIRHDNDDHILATIGKSILQKDHDGSFFKQKNKT